MNIVGMAGSFNIEKVIRGDYVALSEHHLLVKSTDSFLPKTKVNVGYIVSAVLINDEDKILLVQEAKRSCRGEW